MRLCLRIALDCVLCGVLTACSGRAGPQQPPPTGAAAEKERREAPTPAPVTRDGTRYEAVLWGRARGLPQNGGYVAAVDERTGAELWLVKVYDRRPDNGMEEDKLDVFITRLELSADGQALRVTNELGAVYRLDLRTRSVVKEPTGGQGADPGA